MVIEVEISEQLISDFIHCFQEMGLEFTSSEMEIYLKEHRDLALYGVIYSASDTADRDHISHEVAEELTGEYNWPCNGDSDEKRDKFFLSFVKGALAKGYKVIEDAYPSELAIIAKSPKTISSQEAQHKLSEYGNTLIGVKLSQKQMEDLLTKYVDLDVMLESLGAHHCDVHERFAHCMANDILNCNWVDDHSSDEHACEFFKVFLRIAKKIGYETNPDLFEAYA